MAADRSPSDPEALRGRGGIFVDALRAARMPMVLTDPTLQGDPIVFANPAFLQLSGYGLDDVVGRDPQFLDGPDTDTQQSRRLRQMLDDDRDGAVETIQYAKGGRRFAATVLFSAFTGADGSTLHHVLSWSEVADDRPTDRALQPGEGRYRTLFEAMDEACAVVEVLQDEAGRWTDVLFLEVNPAFLQHTSMPWPVGKTARQLLGDPNPRWAQLYGQVLDSGSPLRVEEEEPSLRRTFDLNIVALDRRRNRVAVLFTDITARKQAETLLRESEQSRRVALSSGGMGAWRWDTRRGVAYADEVVQRFWGVSTPQQPHPVALYAERMYPEGTAWLAQVAARDIAPGEEFQTQLQVATGPTSSRWYQLRGQAEWEHPWIINGVTFDITEQRLAEQRLRDSEERLRISAEVAGLGFWDWNVQTGAITWSDQHFRMQGYAAGEIDPTYDFWFNRVHPDDRQRTQEALERARDTRTDYVNEFRSVHPDGSTHWLSARGRFFYDGQGDPVRMVGAVIETTERRESEERQKVLVAELQHRTFNLMGLMTSTAEVTMRSSTSLEEFATKFRGRIAALARVQRLLSRLTDETRVTFDELVHSELEAAGAPESGRNVVLEGPRGVALRSRTVQTLAMALHELVTNATKYGALSQPEARLHIRWHVDSGEAGEPWLHVDWRESGVRLPRQASGEGRQGQGRALIERALPYQLRAKTSYRMEADGIHCRIALPVNARPATPTPRREPGAGEKG